MAVQAVLAPNVWSATTFAVHGHHYALLVLVGIETERGPWVASLVAAGYTVYALNPRSAARYRERHSISRAKTDAAAAHALAEIVRLDRAEHRPVAGDSTLAEGIKHGARAHQGLVWERARHVLRLRSASREFYPAALQAFPDMDEPDALERCGSWSQSTRHPARRMSWTSPGRSTRWPPGPMPTRRRTGGATRGPSMSPPWWSSTPAPPVTCARMPVRCSIPRRWLDLPVRHSAALTHEHRRATGLPRLHATNLQVRMGLGHPFSEGLCAATTCGVGRFAAITRGWPTVCLYEWRRCFEARGFGPPERRR